MKVPHLHPGDYVLGWRWDCEESTQVKTMMKMRFIIVIMMMITIMLTRHGADNDDLNIHMNLTFPRDFINRSFGRKAVKIPSHDKSPLRGYPPPPPGPPRTRFFRKVNRKNLTEKGGTPSQVPRPTLRKRHFFWCFSPKKHSFWAKKLMEKVNRKGGYHLPPPLMDGRFPKNERKKVNRLFP